MHSVLGIPSLIGVTPGNILFFFFFTMSKSLFAPESQSGDFQILEAGQYPARCFAVIDIGTHDVEWQGISKKKREVVVMFEFPTELTQFKKDEPKQPFVLSKYMTLSMSDQGKMKPFLESWLGTKFTDATAKAFNMFDLIGKTAFISVTHDESKQGKTFANIGVIMPLPKGMTCPDAITETISYSVKDHDDTEYMKIYPKLQEKIASSDEMKIPQTKTAPVASTPEVDNNKPPF